MPENPLSETHRCNLFLELIFAIATAAIIAGPPMTAFAACQGEPPQDAVEKAKAYYQKNSTLIEHSSRSKDGPGKKIVINDYSKTPTTMYILNSETGECEDSSIVGFGSGKGGSLEGGCNEGSKLSPSGFHITSTANEGSKYPYPVGLTMLPCEGQEETGPRGIMIHPGDPDGIRGNSWGCATLPKNQAEDFISKKIKGGSLVYNYWKDDTSLPGCAKVGKSETCQLPATENAGGSSRGSGGGSGQTRGTSN
jgi:hypothetical protein